jgi:S-layer protein (TIGR01567 family)
MVSKRIALVIGNNYPNSHKELKFAVADAIKMKEVLENKNICYFDDVVLLTDKTSKEAFTELEKLFNKTHQDDLVFIYFSGHGKKDSNNNLRLLLDDTNEELLLATSLPFDFINECRKNSLALMASVIIVLDCCYSSAAGMKDTDIAETLDSYCSTGMVILTSTGSTGSRTAREDEKLGHSVFTYHLIEGLEKGYADGNNDGLISIDDLYDYASLNTKKICQQSPQKKGIIEGKLFFAKNPNKIIENEFILKKDKLVKIFRKELPANVYETSMTVLVDSYEKPDKITEDDGEIRNSLEDLFEGKISVKTYIHTVQCLLKNEYTENSHASISSSAVRIVKEKKQQEEHQLKPKDSEVCLKQEMERFQNYEEDPKKEMLSKGPVSFLGKGVIVFSLILGFFLVLYVFLSPQSSLVNTYHAVDNVNKSYFQQAGYESDAWKNQNYTLIQLFGKNYVSFGSPPNIKLAELLIDSDNKINIQEGEALALGNGYSIDIIELDYNIQTVWIEIEKDGEVIFEDYLATDKPYNLKWDILGDKNIVLRINHSPVIKGEIDGGNASFVQINGLWFVDYENAFTIKPGDKLNGYEIVGINDKYISYKSSDSHTP